MEIQVRDTVRGWFGVGVVTDIGHGFLVDQITDEPYTDEDDLVRIEQAGGKATYIYRKDVDEVLDNLV